MGNGNKDHDTICALSTPHGIGGISIIRVSGDSAFRITLKLAGFFPEKPESHRVYYGTIWDFERKNKIDEVLITSFLKGKSYTGEDSVEISCHGNPVIVSWILRELVSCGARPAERGEFTFRAFMNGRLDLLQAESVLSLIESQSQRSAQYSLRNLKGGLSLQLNRLEELVLWCLSRLEVSIDFSAENFEIVSKEELLKNVFEVKQTIEKLLLSYKSGRILQDGLQILLVGAPNVGKSSLLNLFAQEDRAIVTDEAGTTRDIIEYSLIQNGYRLRLLDSAGIREADNKVERIGIDKTLKEIGKSDLIFFIFDSSRGINEDEVLILNQTDPSQVLIVGNKIDLAKVTPSELLANFIKSIEKSIFYKKIQDHQAFFNERVFFLSALLDKSRNELFGFIDRFIELNSLEDQAIIFQNRHFEALTKMKVNIDNALTLIQEGTSAEFISLELKETLLRIHETLGKRFDDQIMDEVFKQFCIGK